MTGTSKAWPESTTVIFPSNAGAWVPTPVAFSTPVTPSGRSSVASVSPTPAVSSSVFFAAAIVSSGVAPNPESEPPLQAVTTSTVRTATSAGATRLRRSPRSASHTGPAAGPGTEPGGDGSGDGGDRLGAGQPGAVPAAGGLGQVHRGAAGG